MTAENKTKTNDAKNGKTQSKTAAKPAEVMSKTQIRNAAAQANKLLRGIDNEVSAIQKAQKNLEERTKKVAESAVLVNNLLGGISNVALSNGDQVKAAVKPVVKASAKPAAKPAAKPVVKASAKPAAKPAKTAAKPAKTAAKPAKSDKPAVKAVERPALKQVIDDILSNGPMKASTIYAEACKKYGKWSRQSLYNALKDSKYSKTGDGANAFFSSGSGTVTDDEANALIRKVEESGVIANVV